METYHIITENKMFVSEFKYNTIVQQIKFKETENKTEATNFNFQMVKVWQKQIKNSKVVCKH